MIDELTENPDGSTDIVFSFNSQANNKITRKLIEEGVNFTLLKAAYGEITTDEVALACEIGLKGCDGRLTHSL
jgi:hypothetical protein